MGRGEETRERIVIEARTLFAEKGFGSTTTAEIAKRAGITEGAIYRHFQDKKELFLSCVEPAVVQAFERSVAGLHEVETLEELVRTTLKIRIQVLREYHESFNILFTEAFHHPELKELLFQRVVLERVETLVPILKQMVEEGKIPRLPNLLFMGLGVTAATWAVLNFRDRAARVPDFCPAPTEEEFVEELTQFVLYGIAGQRSGGTCSE